MGYGVNKEFLIPSNEIPKYPIVVVKLNERVVSVNKAQRNLSPMSIINLILYSLVMYLIIQRMLLQSYRIEIFLVVILEIAQDQYLKI